MAGVTNAAVTFSFASDSIDNGPAFGGGGAGAQDQLGTGTGSPLNLTLLVDPDSTTPGGVASFDASFNFTATAIDHDFTTFGSAVVHNWLLNGSFSFVDNVSGDDILTISFNEAIMTSVSNSGLALGSTATIQASQDLSPSNLTFTPGAALTSLGITAADLSAQENFSFTLTNILSTTGTSHPMLGSNGTWQQAWLADGSFSASAIPAPGALALLALSGLIGATRRRRAT
ncbi:MAG: hypothetical protein EA377_07860 [Phycisphaerales bacterium]|nr:MAG: hypothetical protein EA377_07860 [Phycisphaerales bacterium]